MKQKIIIFFSISILLLVIFLIGRDFYTHHSNHKPNLDEYNLDKYKEIDSSLIKYKEIKGIKPIQKEVTGMVISDDGILYICGSDGVEVYDSNRKLIHQFEFNLHPTCITLVENNTLYIGMTDHVEVFSTIGKQLSVWDKTMGDQYITSIACDDNYVFVADAENKFIYKHTFQGKFISMIGKKDSTKGVPGFILPSMYFDIFVDKFGLLWVANTGRHKLENYSDNGTLRTSWGISSINLEGFAGCCNPIHFTMLPNSYFVTYEKGLNRIKIYNQAGVLDGVVVGSSQLEKCNSQDCTNKSMVNDLIADSKFKIYVADAFTNSIRIFVKK